MAGIGCFVLSIVRASIMSKLKTLARRAAHVRACAAREYRNKSPTKGAFGNLY